ncbi:MAG: M48 family metallopeptidase, partial [Planctomycetota bacterium]|nr:M48 family metallopeptidase [Planctomycetota bacterium]
VFLLLKILPEQLPGMGKQLGRRFRKKTRFARKLLKSVEKPSGPLALLEEMAGKDVLQFCLARTPAVEGTQEARRVEETGRKLATQSRRSNVSFRFILVDDLEEPNACAIPGGSILVTQALLDLCPGQDELAGVLAHEIAHIDCYHSLKALGSAFAVQELIGTRYRLLCRATGCIKNLIASGYSQDNEFEADREGAQLAKRAGFNPTGLRKALGIMTDHSLQEKYSFFSTHPPTTERISELRKHFG